MLKLKRKKMPKEVLKLKKKVPFYKVGDRVSFADPDKAVKDGIAERVAKPKKAVKKPVKKAEPKADK